MTRLEDDGATTPDRWEGEVPVSDELFCEVLAETVLTISRGGVPHVFMGGIASTAMGRERWTHDIDVFVKPEDARRTLEVLEAAGFESRVHFPDWLYKAVKHDVLVDVIFRSSGEIYLDDEMLRRARAEEFKGLRMPVIPPEDLVVIKACVHTEQVPRHWHDGIALLRRVDLDWDYLIRRALQHDAHRVLSLVCYARSEGVPVPEDVVARLHEATRSDPFAVPAVHDAVTMEVA